MSETCGNCGNARIETHTGESRLVCWKDARLGAPVGELDTCPSWRERDADPMGEYADALVRRTRDLEQEVEAFRQLQRTTAEGLAMANSIACRAFALAKRLFEIAPKDEMPVEFAVTLHDLHDELDYFGIGAD
ncbi:MAG: hypothetical protein IJ087_18175 [Eggerthellaceae bacterium]|nr:hypothetical protein [Eggerthellaceae bacterium]